MIPPARHSEIAAAAGLLKKGGVVAFPTETVYGLGAEVSNPYAIQRIFEIKRRPFDHPLIIHIADSSKLQYWAEDVPEQAWQLAEHFWPGPLTLILPRNRRIPTNVTGGQDTVGLRVPAHPVALALLGALGPEGALAAPSANRFGHVSPTTADHVRDELGDSVDMILDGGPCEVGLESTIVGFEGRGSSKDGTAMILRPGGIPLAALAEVLHGNISLAERSDRTPRVPGALASHYAPATPLELWPSADLPRRALELEAKGLHLVIVTWSPHYPKHMNYRKNKNTAFFSMPSEAENYGRMLYATLRRFDNEDFDCLLVEAPPDAPEWMAVVDRLRRASCADALKNPNIEAVHG
ncbi:L-threonylcarbamoyladenylate synthase [Nitrosovibrio tenuis]|uniref:Threonylcarbamoyl-AMP synthase n=1 Tax=Nitrosovibrio tenuis TaxID=1233 RepID=A0A1H7GL94_9PROT|nr:L-threonylcarbamoyladenylate synthase [Nitrosovibrio tenuis]SEK38878.1 translation factor SUA5 [Nitrosovibrio tenuis]